MNKITKSMLKKNNSREEAILDENQEIYTNMVVYLRGSDLTEYNQELVREDLIELILDGQERGDDIQKVMGGNYKEICDDIIDAMPKMSAKEKIIDLVGTSLNMLWILGAINVIINFTINLIDRNSEFNFTLSIGDILAGIIIIIFSNGVVWYVTKTALNEQQINIKKKRSLFKGWLSLVMVFATILFAGLYFDTVVINIHLITAVIIISLIFIASKIINSRVY
ncbi:MAG TPA: hypothetical protein GXZ58_07535 [Bacilli bacterium]|nr:hypothetical protein [Bacilli bacterium]